MNYPNFCLIKENSQELQQFLRENLYESLQADEQNSEKAPLFLSNYFKVGAWIVNCENKDSVDWLKKQVSELKLLINDEEVPLKVVPLQDIKIFKLSIIIADQKVSNETILQRFELQNSSLKLKTSPWEITSRFERDNDKLLLEIEVDQFSHDIIKSNDSKLYFDFEKVHVCSVELSTNK